MYLYLEPAKDINHTCSTEEILYSILSFNSKASASDLMENLEEMCSVQPVFKWLTFYIRLIV